MLLLHALQIKLKEILIQTRNPDSFIKKTKTITAKTQILQ